MSVIYYRFKSGIQTETVKFDDVQISVGELRTLVMQKERMSKGGDYDLQILNAQTSRVYDKNEEMIPRNSSVIVSRVPRIGGSSKKPREVDEDTKMSKAREAAAQSLLTASKPRNEDEALKLAMQQQQSLLNTDSSTRSRFANPPPASYVCFRCNRGGHWIQQCPGVAAGDGVEAKIVKKSTGIPSSFMKIVNDPTIPGAMLTPSGHYAVPMLEAEAYKEQKREKMPFGNDENPEYRRVDRPIPPELKCGICQGILRQAVVIPCCGSSFCDDCNYIYIIACCCCSCPLALQQLQQPECLVVCP